MKPNFETGCVEMTESEFTQLYGYAYRTDTGRALENFNDIKRAYRDFLTACHEQTDDGAFHVSVNSDAQTWSLDEYPVNYALNKLSLVSGRLATAIGIERLPGYQGSEADLRTRPTDHDGATSLAHGMSLYLDLLGCQLELQSEQNTTEID